MSAWEIQKLTKQHDRTSFDCGEQLLNDWIQMRARQFAQRDLAQTFVATATNSTSVVGFYSLTSHHLPFNVLPELEAKGLPGSFDVPVVLLGRLAVDRSVQGQGLGSILMADALRRSVHHADDIGTRGMEVHALNDSAKSFYIKHGFRILLDDPLHLFMPMHDVRKLQLP